jgi:hypothetical protein
VPFADVILRFRNREFVGRHEQGVWRIAIGAGWYFLGPDAPKRRFATFARERLRNYLEDSPSMIASLHHPLLLHVDDHELWAWPAFVPRNRPGWAKTYVNPASGIRVLATRGPVWMFESEELEASEGGETSPRQTVDDVRELARQWLAAHRSTG